METLKCTKCKEIKSTDLFYKHKKTGFQSNCKICAKEYLKEYYKENKEKIKEQQKQYLEENKEKIKEQQKQHRKENKGKRKQYRKENREKLSEYHKQYQKENKEKINQQNRKIINELRTSYVKTILKRQGFKSEQITEELIQLKTITLKTQRLCNQLKN